MQFVKESLILVSLTCLVLCSAFKPNQIFDQFENVHLDSDTCYIKSVMPDKYESTWKRLPIYNGSDSSIELLEYKRTTGEAKTRWVTKVDKNCKSDNPDDCTVYCFEAYDIETETIMYLADTVTIKDFEYKYVENKVLKSRGGNYDFQPALCSDKVNQVMISKICFKLAAKGYIARTQCKGKLDENFAKGLNEFQKDNNLPIGGLNYVTLDKLKIRY